MTELRRSSEDQSSVCAIEVDPEGVELFRENGRARGVDKRTVAAGLARDAVSDRPKSFALGVGCDRDTPAELLERGVAAVLAQHGLSPTNVCALASIDKKRDEPGLLALAEAHGWPLRFYTAEELARVPSLERPSDAVSRHVGTRGVAEPAALLCAGASALIVPKTVYTEEGAGRSMTIAVARVPFAKRAEVGRE